MQFHNADFIRIYCMEFQSDYVNLHHLHRSFILLTHLIVSRISPSQSSFRFHSKMLLGNKFKSAGLPQNRSEVYMGSDGQQYVLRCLLNVASDDAWWCWWCLMMMMMMMMMLMLLLMLLVMLDWWCFWCLMMPVMLVLACWSWERELSQAKISLCSSESVCWKQFQNSMKSLLGSLEQSSAESSWANRGLKFALFEPIQRFGAHLPLAGL